MGVTEHIDLAGRVHVHDVDGGLRLSGHGGDPHSCLDPSPCRTRGVRHSGLVCPAANASATRVDDIAILAVSKHEHAVFPSNSHGTEYRGVIQPQAAVIGGKDFECRDARILEARKFAVQLPRQTW